VIQGLRTDCSLHCSSSSGGADACQCCRSTSVVCHCLQMCCSVAHADFSAICFACRCHNCHLKQCKPDRCLTHGLCRSQPTVLSHLLHHAAGVPSTPGRPLIDFSKELPPPAALAVPAGGHGGPGSIQPQSIKLALEASDMMLANKERDANKVGSARTAFALWLLLLCTGWWSCLLAGENTQKHSQKKLASQMSCLSSFGCCCQMKTAKPGF